MRQLNFKSMVQNVFFAIVILFTISSCKKEIRESEKLSDEPLHSLAAKNKAASRGYSDHFIASFTATNFVFENGFNAPPTGADFPGGGEGNVSHMGKCTNQV